jgi:Kef-type K+ transport system membrane component KefB
MPTALLTGAAPADAVPTVLLSLAFVVVAARLAGVLCERLGQPAVLGELLVGLLLGNLALAGGPDLAALRSSESFVVLAELGAVLLLFQVGLESRLTDMARVGAAAMAVAIVGVVTPMGLGWGLAALAHPGESWMAHAFVGAMLAATSVGITARVLGDLGALQTLSARIILGAAVIDDVLGLLVLAVLAGLVAGAATGSTIGPLPIAWIVGRALVFLAGSLLVGSVLSPRIFRGALALRSTGLVQSLSLGFCFLLAWLATRAGLAPIVGAFAAGLVLEEAHFERNVEAGERRLHDSLAPLVALLVPVFFVRMGMLVDLRSFARPGVLGFALLLTAAAVVGKWACALVVPRRASRLLVAIGMMPRGEVGLIFAGIGAGLVLDGRPVVAPGTYAAAVLMVVLTTLVTPPLLQWAARREEGTP